MRSRLHQQLVVKKIKTTIHKFISHQLYQEYSELYIFLLKKKQQRYKKFDAQGYFLFEETKNIIDFNDLLTRNIKHLETKELKKVYNFILSEIDTNNTEIKAFNKIKDMQPIHNQIQIWQYRPFLFHYLNIHRLLSIAAISGLRPSYIPVKGIDEFGNIRTLPFDDYHRLIAFAEDLLENWHPIVLNLQQYDNLTKSHIGCIFEFFQTDFVSKNIKFWDVSAKKPQMYGIYKKDPHLYFEVENMKIYLPINLAWMATDTSFHNFGVDNGKVECLSGICILKSISSNKEALFTPLLIGVYDYFAEMQQAVIQGKRDLEIRTSW
ncbi:MAG: hypothetical protein V7K32_07035 [Nostoc sp.]|uniref:hypothetical protein n=1 Tax=Nostoc sp. TaxID=1180 RepID=UPI002FF94734